MIVLGNTTPDANVLEGHPCATDSQHDNAVTSQLDLRSSPNALHVRHSRKHSTLVCRSPCCTTPADERCFNVNPRIVMAISSPIGHTTGTQMVSFKARADLAEFTPQFSSVQQCCVNAVGAVLW